MKLISYLEKKIDVGTVDIANGEYNIDISYKLQDSKRQKKINFKISTGATIPELSEMINKNDNNLSISANDDIYKNKKKLHQLFLEKDPEFYVIYDDTTRKYQVKVINVIEKVKRFFIKN